MPVSKQCHFSKVAAALAAMCFFAIPVRAEDNPPDTQQVGQRVFLLCQPCHSMDPDGRDKIGPNLWGIFGRRAGTKAGFHYSDALKGADVVWSEKTLDQWLANPRQFVPGNRMAFSGVSNADNRAALIAYLKQASVAH